MEAGSDGSGERGGNVDEGPLDRLLQGLNHPLRRRIIGVLAGGQRGSAKSLSDRLELPLPSISYHLNKVLAQECGLVELVERIPRRGAEEKIYVLDEKAIAAGLALIRCPKLKCSRPLDH